MITLASKFLLVSVFLVTGIKGLFNPSKYVEMIAGKGFPMPLAITYFILLLKIIGSAAILAGKETKLAAMALAVFTVVTTVIYHNFWLDPSQLTTALRNLGLVGGLFFWSIR